MVKKIKLNSDGSIEGIPDALKQIQSQKEFIKSGTNNQSNCSGINRGNCKNSGQCQDTTNMNFCSNTGVCDTATNPL